MDESNQKDVIRELLSFREVIARNDEKLNHIERTVSSLFSSHEKLLHMLQPLISKDEKQQSEIDTLKQLVMADHEQRLRSVEKKVIAGSAVATAIGPVIYFLIDRIVLGH